MADCGRCMAVSSEKCIVDGTSRLTNFVVALAVSCCVAHSFDSKLRRVAIDMFLHWNGPPYIASSKSNSAMAAMAWFEFVRAVPPYWRKRSVVVIVSFVVVVMLGAQKVGVRAPRGSPQRGASWHRTRVLSPFTLYCSRRLLVCNLALCKV